MSSALVEGHRSLLSAEAKAVVEATATVVAAHAEKITARFYPAMFQAHPELPEPPRRADHTELVLIAWPVNNWSSPMRRRVDAASQR